MEQLPPDKEASQIRSIWRPKVNEGEQWALVESKWWDMWERYSGFNRDKPEEQGGCGGPRPGPIGNNLLQDGENELALRRGIQAGADYVLVHESVWKKIKTWYKGGPEFIRGVVVLGMMRETRVDLFPSILKFTFLNAEGEPDESTTQLKHFRNTKTFDDVRLKFEMTVEEPTSLRTSSSVQPYVRFWMKQPVKKPEVEDVTDKEEDKDETKDEEKEKKEEMEWQIVSSAKQRIPLEQLELACGTEVWVEVMGDNGQWKRSSGKKNWREFEVNDIIDAQDTVKKWYESTIMEIKEKEKKVLVHYNGWAKKWDVWMDMDSEKLAPRNTHTVGPYVSKSQRYSYDPYGWRSDEAGAPEVQGVVGLRNLGNTCFMNSTLQCMSNCKQLTNYLLDDRHKAEVNRTNPLGWQGRIADEYGDFIHKMWGKKFRVVAPSQFKRVLGEFAPRFSGYNQQDSSELLSFLLDGLHEDLNKIKKKPYTQVVESKEGEEDREVALRAWETHLKRNDSIIVRLFQGQLKSKVKCPNCPRVSITFDPFMFLSVPLPTFKNHFQPCVFVSADPAVPLYKLTPLVSKVSFVLELKESVAATMGVPVGRLAVADVYSRSIYRVFNDEDKISDLDRCKIYIYEIPELEGYKPRSFEIIPVLHQMVKGDTVSDNKSLPACIALPLEEKTSYEEVHRRVNAAVRRFVKPDVEMKGDERPYRLSVLDRYGRECGWCSPSWSSAEPRCIGHPLPAKGGKTFQLSKVDKWGYKKQVALGVWWENGGQAFRDNVLQEVEEHPSMKAGQVAEASSKITLDSCIGEFTREETLSKKDPWYCSQCKEFRQATKKFDVWTLPEVLIIHLKRFHYSRHLRERIDDLVDFPMRGLDMSRFCVNPDETAVYDLFAVSNHRGSLGGGHYTAYAKNIMNGKWFEFDDSHCRPVEEDRVVSSMSYVLFYEKRKREE